MNLIAWLEYELAYYDPAVHCFGPVVRVTRVQSQVASYQRLKKWYLMLLCLTLSNIRYVSRVKWSNSGKGVALFLHLGVVAYSKGSLLVALDYGRQLYSKLIIWCLWWFHLYNFCDIVCFTQNKSKKTNRNLSEKQTGNYKPDFSRILIQLDIPRNSHYSSYAYLLWPF